MRSNTKWAKDRAWALAAMVSAASLVGCAATMDGAPEGDARMQAGELVSPTAATPTIGTCATGVWFSGACRDRSWVQSSLATGTVRNYGSCAEDGVSGCSLWFTEELSASWSGKTWNTGLRTYFVADRFCTVDCAGRWDIVRSAVFDMSFNDSGASGVAQFYVEQSSTGITDTGLSKDIRIEWSESRSRWEYAVYSASGNLLDGMMAMASVANDGHTWGYYFCDELLGETGSWVGGFVASKAVPVGLVAASATSLALGLVPVATALGNAAVFSANPVAQVAMTVAFKSAFKATASKIKQTGVCDSLDEDDIAELAPPEVPEPGDFGGDTGGGTSGGGGDSDSGCQSAGTACYGVTGCAFVGSTCQCTYCDGTVSSDCGCTLDTNSCEDVEQDDPEVCEAGLHMSVYRPRS